MGDHGMVAVPCDQRWPFLSLRIPRSLVSHPELAVVRNTSRHSIVSGWDLYATLRHIANIGVHAGAGDAADIDWFGMRDVESYGSLEVAPPLPFQMTHSIALPSSSFAPRSILQGISASRSCAEAGIMELNCAGFDDALPSPVVCVGSDQEATESEECQTGRDMAAHAVAFFNTELASTRSG